MKKITVTSSGCPATDIFDLMEEIGAGDVSTREILAKLYLAVTLIRQERKQGKMVKAPAVAEGDNQP